MSELVVAVYREGRSYRVEPARVVVRHGDSVTVFSVGGTPLTVLLPPAISGEPVFIPLGGSNPRFATLPLKPGIIGGCYEYAVHVDEERAFAEGGSQPKIIILE